MNSDIVGEASKKKQKRQTRHVKDKKYPTRSAYMMLLYLSPRLKFEKEPVSLKTTPKSNSNTFVAKILFSFFVLYYFYCILYK